MKELSVELRSMPRPVAALLSLGSVAVVSAYLYLHPMPRSSASWTLDGTLSLPLIEILFTFALFAGIQGAGLHGLDLIGASPDRRGGSPSESLLAGLVVGTLVVSTVTLGLGLVGLFNSKALGFLFVLLCIAALRARSPFVKAMANLLRAVCSLPGWWRVGPILLSLLLVLPFLQALSPPTGYDALFYHLTVPAGFLEKGVISEASTPPLGHYPFAVQMLFSIGMSILSDRVPGLIQLGFHLATLHATAALARRFVSGPGWMAAMLVFAGVPYVQRFAGQAFVDLPVACFIVIGTLFLTTFLSGSDRRDLTIAALAAGAACCVKHVGMFGALMLLVMLVQGRHQRGVGFGQDAVRFVLICAVTFGPWLAKSALWTANPLFPAGNQELFRVFRSLGIPPSRIEILKLGWFSEDPRLSQLSFSSGLKLMGRGCGVIDLLLLPVYLSVDSRDQSVDEAPVHFCGEGSPLFLALLLFLPLGTPGKIGRLAPLLIGGLFLFFEISMVSQQQRFYLPVYALLAVPAAGVLVSRGVVTSLAAFLSAFVWTWGLSASMILSWSRGDLPASVGLLSRESYLIRELECHGAFSFANRHLSPACRVLLCFEPRAYYLKIPHEGDDPSPGLRVLETLFASSSAEDFLDRVRRRGVTHLYVPRHGFALLTEASDEEDYRKTLERLFKRDLRRIYGDGHGFLFEIPGPPFKVPTLSSPERSRR